MRRSAALLLAFIAPALAGDPPKVNFSELPNGLDVLIVEKHGSPLVTIELAVRTGSFTETPENNGLSHLYEHMFFKGNEALPTQQAYMARVHELGIQFNGTTSTERVNYFITLPSRNFTQGMQFMADAMLTPLFNQDELVAERPVVASEYDRNDSNPEWHLVNAMRQQMYGDQAYRKDPLGKREIIMAATQETMREFRAKYYLPNNAALLIVGDVNPTEARVMAERLFGPRSWKDGPDPHSPPREPLPRLQETKSVIVEHPDAGNVTLMLEWPGPDVGRDDRATFVADVWGTLCGLPQARFQRVLRDKKVTAGAVLGYYTQREGGEISFRGVVRDGKVAETRDTVLAELNAMADPSYWTADEIALAKKRLAIMRAEEGESGEDFSHNLSFWWASASYDYYLRYLEECATTTPQELANFVRNYVIGRPLVAGCLLKPEVRKQLELTEEKLRPGAEAAQAALVEELNLDGLRVLVRNIPGSSMTACDLYLRDAWVDMTKELQGIDLLMVSMLPEGSTKTPRAAVQAKLLGLGARVGRDANYDHARISLVAPNDGFGEALAVLSECLREPLLDPAVIDEAKNGLLAALNAEKANNDRYLARVVNEGFFAGHPFANRPDGTPATIPTLDREAVLKRWGQFDRQRMLVVLVGDFDAARAKALLEPALQFVPKLQRPWTQRPEVPEFKPGKLLTHEQRDKLPLTYLGAKIVAPAQGDEDYPAMKLCLSLLDRRLFEVLRTKHSLTYAQGAGGSIYRRNYAQISCSAREPLKVLPLMHEEMRRLSREPVAKEELAAMVASEETASLTALESAGSHANMIGRAELMAGSWRKLYDAPAALRAVTPADIQRVAAKYLRGFTWGVIGPAAPGEAELRGETPK